VSAPTLGEVLRRPHYDLDYDIVTEELRGLLQAHRDDGCSNCGQEWDAQEVCTGTELDAALDALNRIQAHKAEQAATIERLTKLTHEWNVEAARVGIAGSEYIDDPARVFARVRDGRDIEARVRARLTRELDAYRSDLSDAASELVDLDALRAENQRLREALTTFPAVIERLHEEMLTRIDYIRAALSEDQG